MRVLLLEDDAKMARIIRRGLKHEGYAVEVVADGDESLSRASEFDYDAIILDVMVPGPDGFAVCGELPPSR